jgi:ribonuclease HI/DNA polymerase-3 subunit epsilon
MTPNPLSCGRLFILVWWSLIMSIQPVILYVDGACKGNPGLGGWGVHIQHPNGQTEDWCGGDKHTTNNRMELMAAIQGLLNTPPAAAIVVWTDSSYVQKGISEWIHGWKKKNWRKADGGPVSNADLWQQLDQASQQRQIDWRWIKGHAGHAGNEHADQLANLGTEYAQQGHYQAQNVSHTRTASTPIIASQDWLRNDPLGFDCLDPSDEPLDPNDTPAVDPALAALAHDPFAGLEPSDDPAAEWHDLDHARAEDQRQPIALTPPVSSPVSAAATPVSLHSTDTVPTLARATHGPRQLILDTETTGFDPSKGDRVIEIGIIEMVERKLTGNSMHVYLNPERQVGDSEAIHGLSDAFLADKALFASIAQQLCDFVEGGEIIAHNANFDMNFLEAELRRCGIAPLAGRVQVTDTLAIAKRKHAGQKNSLDALVKRYDIKPRDRKYHGALLDAEILADVYLAMTGGQVTLEIGQNEHGSHSTGHRKLNPRRLTVIAAPADELALHHTWLDQMEQKSGSTSLWRTCGLT